MLVNNPIDRHESRCITVTGLAPWYLTGFWIVFVVACACLAYAYYRGYKTHCLEHFTTLHVCIPFIVAVLWPFAVPVLLIALIPGYDDHETDSETFDEARTQSAENHNAHPTQFSQKEI